MNLIFHVELAVFNSIFSNIIQSLIVILVTCLMIWKASDGFELASDYFGDKLNMEGGVKGATINAVGSSLPELFTTFFFLVVLKDARGFAGGLGTTAGSAVFNSMIIPAVVILAVAFSLGKTVIVNPKVILRDGLFLISAELILIVLLNSTALTWVHGLILMLVYGVYIFILKKVKIKDEDSDDDDDDDDDEEYDGSRNGLIRAIFTLDLEALIVKGRELDNRIAGTLLFVAVLIMGAACYSLAYVCESLGHELGISSFIVAIIFAAAATSVPDTILSIKDAKNGNYNDAVANALGSNIFDICFALGFPLFVYTLANGGVSIPIQPEDNDIVGQFRVLLLLLTVTAFLIYYIGKKMTKVKAVLLLSVYGIFIAYTLAYAYNPESISGIQAVLFKINSVLGNLNFL
ncbi:sodium:calcium antiporter [Flammeovirga aprica JL-4]|uniref:Sodium:calcium antiporter n=2 Tax=Flammeovirga aprica TaxID=29528 RepID=A0A7X9RWP4_9BACT|nr:sodium:calcium antiporter [Flammeovirga aprica JL-4]